MTTFINIESICLFIISIAKRNNAKTKKKRQSLYSIEFSPPVDTILDYEMNIESSRNTSSELSPKPMTPRRVKRRSVMTRGTTGRQSRRSHGSNRNSMRSSRRKFQQNPVTKLMEYQHGHTDMSTQNEGMKNLLLCRRLVVFFFQFCNNLLFYLSHVQALVIKCIN